MAKQNAPTSPNAPDSADKKEPAAEAGYKVLSNLDHDGQLFAPGDTVYLTEAQAKPLLGGAIAAE